VTIRGILVALVLSALLWAAIYMVWRSING
jgi:hypothetical protein